MAPRFPWPRRKPSSSRRALRSRRPTPPSRSTAVTATSRSTRPNVSIATPKPQNSTRARQRSSGSSSPATSSEMDAMPDHRPTSTSRFRKPVADFMTTSGEPVQPVYTPADVDRAGVTYDADLGDPGAFPFTRGIHETMYRGKLWTMRLFSGFGSAEETNARFRYLLAHGETG